MEQEGDARQAIEQGQPEPCWRTPATFRRRGGRRAGGRRPAPPPEDADQGEDHRDVQAAADGHGRQVGRPTWPRTAVSTTIMPPMDDSWAMRIGRAGDQPRAAANSMAGIVAWAGLSAGLICLKRRRKAAGQWPASGGMTWIDTAATTP